MSTEFLTHPETISSDRCSEGLEGVPYYIPVTEPSARPRRSLKNDDTFAVLDSYGDIGAATGGPDGLFCLDTRFLSRLELRLNGLPPLLLGSSISDDNAVLNVDLTNPDIFADKRLVLKRDTVHIVRTSFLRSGVAYQRFGVKSYDDKPITILLSIFFGSDFADIFEVRGYERARRGVIHADKVDPSEMMLNYEGLDGAIRRTSVRFDPIPARLNQDMGLYQLNLVPLKTVSIFLAIGCNQVTEARAALFYKALRGARHDLRAAARRATSIETSNNVFNEMLCRSISDLYMLVTNTPEGPYPYAGIPWYSTTFGRDGLITALETLWLDPSIARGVLRRLAAYQAKSDDPVADAAPGKILHEMRGGELAALGEIPFALYYGSVDSTPLFVLLAGLYAERTGDNATMTELWPALEAALDWIDGPGDPDRDGFVEYQRGSQQGLANQGWKDLHDSIFHANGHAAEGPIALAEVQGYVYAAKHLAGRCARRLGKERMAIDLELQAQDLASRFEDAFWCPDIGTYAIALDGAKTPCRARTSNAGQLLFTGIVRPDRAAKVAEGLLGHQFFSGWGIRTVAKTETRYNPMSYHNGSIWPHDNALIALGLARYGHKAAIDPVFRGLFEAATYMDLRRLPELFCGFQRRRRRGPTLYPVACSPQAWASGAPLLLLQASLGLEFDHEQCEIRLRDPSLPAFLGTVRLRNLCLRDASVDVVVRRHNKSASVEVVRTQGRIQVSVVHGGVTH